ncbi:hypothetical protein JCGZ_13624 [Jatropha curcas]|uniref:Uncharacterized protein n=1 Tax=Jatropha curcas TaxID=180498 RepID=A0A067KDD0_JATCU|nr:hypothetical protein JCGZ_13624 [Jatropha curcas]
MMNGSFRITDVEDGDDNSRGAKEQNLTPPLKTTNSQVATALTQTYALFTTVLEQLLVVPSQNNRKQLLDNNNGSCAHVEPKLSHPDNAPKKQDNEVLETPQGAEPEAHHNTFTSNIHKSNHVQPMMNNPDL